MRAWLKKWWPVGKVILGLAVLFFIGRRFAEDLQEPGLWERSFHTGWMAVSGILYILALGFSGLFWYRLLRGFDQKPTLGAALRAYYVGHLGKYTPGKALALVMRAGLVAGPRVGVGRAGLTAFYEVLTTMTTGALLAAGLFVLLLPAGDAPIDWAAFWGLFRLENTGTAALDRRILVPFALVMAVIIGTFTVPPIFNRLAQRLSQPFREKDAPPLPRFRLAFLVEGILLTACGWFLMGASLWAMLLAVLDESPTGTLPAWGLLTGFMGVSYVAGFIILIVPSGLGVREFFLVLFLVDPAAGRPRPTILLAVLLLRLVWTAAEVIVAAAVYWLPVAGKVKSPS
jgi:hypothetical protein